MSVSLSPAFESIMRKNSGAGSDGHSTKMSCGGFHWRRRIVKTTLERMLKMITH